MGSGHKISAHLALIIANILLGMNFSFFISVIHHYMPFQALFFLRVLGSALFFLPFMVFDRQFRITWKDFLGILVPTVLVIFGHQFMMLWGVGYTNPIESSTIATLAPVITLVVSAFLLHEKIHIAKVIGIFAAIGGAGLLIFDEGIPQAQSEEIGNLLILVSVIAAATNTVFIKPMLMKLGTFVVMGWYYMIGMLFCAPLFGGSLLNTDWAAITTGGYFELAYILVLGTIFPNYLLYYGTEKLTSVHTGVYSYFQVLAAAGLSLLRGQVDLDWKKVTAAVLIFIGVLLVVMTYERYKFPVPDVQRRPKV